MSLATSVFYGSSDSNVSKSLSGRKIRSCCAACHLSPFSLPRVSISQVWTRSQLESQLESKVELTALDNLVLDADLNQIPFGGPRNVKSMCWL